MAADWRERVLDEVDDSEAGIVETLAEFVRLPSVGGTDEENDAQDVMRRQLDASGLEVDVWQLPLDDLLAADDFPGVEVERREAWGVVGRLPGRGDGPSLMLNGHVDVVPPGDLGAWTTATPYSGEVSDGVLYGRGACDMKAGVVASLFAVRALRRVGVPLRGDVLLACVQGEEDGGLGTYALLQRGWTADACVIPEPTGLDLVPANAGALTFRLRVPGRATHASRRLEGVSAVEKFWPLWQELRRLEERRNKDVDPLVAHWELPYPLSIGTVGCGDWASTVPDLLIAEGRLGVALDEPVEAARGELEDAVAQACGRDPWLREHPASVEWWGGQFASGGIPVDSELVGQVRSAHCAVSDGSVPGVWGAPYGSDLRLLVGHGGIPTLQYGPGDAAKAHAPDECVPLDEVMTAARALAVLALDVCGITDDNGS